MDANSAPVSLSERRERYNALKGQLGELDCSVRDASYELLVLLVQSRDKAAEISAEWEWISQSLAPSDRRKASSILLRSGGVFYREDRTTISFDFNDLNAITLEFNLDPGSTYHRQSPLSGISSLPEGHRLKDLSSSRITTPAVIQEPPSTPTIVDNVQNTPTHQTTPSSSPNAGATAPDDARSEVKFRRSPSPIKQEDDDARSPQQTPRASRSSTSALSDTPSTSSTASESEYRGTPRPTSSLRSRPQPRRTLATAHNIETTSPHPRPRRAIRSKEPEAHDQGVIGNRTCGVCGLTLYNNEYARRHVHTMHGEGRWMAFVCPLESTKELGPCALPSKNINNFRRHLRTVHKKTADDAFKLSQKVKQTYVPNLKNKYE